MLRCCRRQFHLSLHSSHQAATFSPTTASIVQKTYQSANRYLTFSPTSLSIPARRHHYSKPSWHPRLNNQNHIQASYSSYFLFTLVVCASAVAVEYYRHPSSDAKTADEENTTPRVIVPPSPVDDRVPDFDAMAVPTGRIGNLTPDEERKLQEFYIALFKTLGVHDERQHVNGSAHPAQAPTPPASVYSETASTKKGKRFSLLGRSRGAANAAEEDDKYGQTAEFKKILASTPPDVLRDCLWTMIKCDHPDALMLRFLRARKWDVDKALAMLISTMDWRARQMHVDDDIILAGEEGASIEENGDDPVRRREGHDFLTQMRMGKSMLHGVDIEGRPVTYIRARLHRGGEQTEKSLERYTIFVTEAARLTLKEPVETGALVFDLTGFTMANMDYTPVKFIIKIFEANYPESLGVIVVHKAPWIFNAIWKVIRGWLDPVVASKVHFTSNVQEMDAYIPRKNLIKELGGDDDWEYKYIEPIPGENEKMGDTQTRSRLIDERNQLSNQMQDLTFDWLAAGVASPQSRSIMEKRHEVAKQLTENYWTLDPYIRARSLWDREGMVLGHGKTNFFPTTNTAEKAEEVKREWTAAIGGDVNYEGMNGHAVGSATKGIGSLPAAQQSSNSVNVWYDAKGSHRELMEDVD